MAADFDADRLLIHLDRAEEERALEPETIAAFRELVEAERDRRRFIAEMCERMTQGAVDRVNRKVAEDVMARPADWVEARPPDWYSDLDRR